MCNPPTTDQRNAERLQVLALRYQACPGDGLFEQITACIAPFLERVRQRHVAPHMPDADLRQHLLLRLHTCLENYRADSGVLFWTYLYRSLTLEAARQQTRDTGPVHVPVWAQEADAARPESRRDPGVTPRYVSWNEDKDARETPDPHVERKVLLAQLLNTLSLSDREVFTARYVQQRTYQEIAHKRGVSKEAIRLRLARIASDLREEALARGLSCDLLLGR